MNEAKQIRFGVFEVDPDAGELRKAGRRVRLQEQPLRILLALVETPGNVVTRDDLRKRIWGEDVHVDFERSLNSAVGRLREALGDSSANPRFIETVPRRGYRLIAPLDRGDPAPKPSPSRLVWWGAGAVTAAALLFWAGAGWGDRQEEAMPPAPRQLTLEPGFAAWPQVTSDGRFVVYGSDQDGDVDLYVRPTAGGEARRLTNMPGHETRVHLTPDSRVLFFSTRDQHIYEVPLLGGETKLFLKDSVNARVSPGGTWLAYTYTREGFSVGLRIVPTNGGETREITPELRCIGAGLLWLDDSRLIAGGSPTCGVAAGDFYMVDAATGETKPTGVGPALIEQGLRYQLPPPPFEPMARLAKERAWLFPALLGNTVSIWSMPFSPDEYRAAGPAELVVQGSPTARYAHADDQGRIVYSQVRENIDLWRIPVDAERGLATGAAERLTRGLASESSPRVAAAATLLFYREMPPAGDGPVELKLAPSDNPSASRTIVRTASDPRYVAAADGSKVVYTISDGDQRRLMLQSTDGTPARTVCRKCGDGAIYDWSADQRFVLFGSPPYPAGVAVLDLETDQTTLATGPSPTPAHDGRFSPDGKWIAFDSSIRGPNVRQVFVVPFEWGREVPRAEWIAVTEGGFNDHRPVWSPSGNHIYFLSERDGKGAIWSRALDPTTKRPDGPAKKVFEGKEPGLYFGHNLSSSLHLSQMDVTKDSIFVDRVEMRGDIWILEPQ